MSLDSFIKPVLVEDQLNISLKTQQFRPNEMEGRNNLCMEAVNYFKKLLPDHGEKFEAEKT